MTPAAFCQHSSFQQNVKQLSIKQLGTQLSGARFDKSVPAGIPSFDSQCPYADTIQPVPIMLRRELRTIIRTNVLLCASFLKSVTESFHNIFTGQSSRYINGKTLTGVFIKHRQHP